MGTWTEEADAYLREVSASSTIQQMAAHLEREPKTVRWRCKKLGLSVLDGRGSEEARAAISAARSVVARTDTQQRCTGCEEWKLYADFALDKSSPSGHTSKCKACVRERWKDWYDADPEKRKAMQRAANRRQAEKHGVQPAIVYRVDEHGRECSKCREYLPWSEFHKSNPNNAACKTCWREHVRKMRYARQYGITTEDFERLEEEQEWACALCGEPEATEHFKTGTRYYLSVDHAHDCGRHDSKQACRYCIRGLLCGQCNRTVGGAESRHAVAKRFQDYLDRRPLLEVISGDEGI